VIGAALLAQVRPEMSRIELVVAVALMGIGMGASIPAFLITVQSSVAKRELGTATSTLQFARTIGGTFGVSVLGALLSFQLAAALATAGLTPDAIPLDALIGEGATGTVELGAQARIALASALQVMFQSTLVVAILAFAVCLLAPRTTAAELAAMGQREEVVAAD
jgi:hypothetical protein